MASPLRVLGITMEPFQCVRLVALAALAFFGTRVLAEDSSQVKRGLPEYSVGQSIPVSCLNRTIETGEHITDSDGQLQYIPFPTCNETGRPLELYFGIEKEINCTIDFVDDPFFHLLEFYVHNDVPLSCRIPARPVAFSSLSSNVGALGSQSSDFIPLIVALTGVLQQSHIHVSNHLNVLMHAAPKSIAKGVIDSATAYSVSHLTRNTKVIIGNPLQLLFSVRWYPTTTLPSGWRGVGGHLYISTLVYCLLSAGAATAVCVAYFRGIDLPRRLKIHGRERAFGLGGGGGGDKLPRYNGYGVGVGNGLTYSGAGKKD